MFDLRYHVASLAAVFLALVIGILVGAGISGRGLLDEAERDRLNGQIASLNNQLDDERLRSREQEAGGELATTGYRALVAGRLDGKRVAIVFVGSVDDGVRASVEQTVADAGGSVVRLRSLTLPIPTEDVEAALRGRRPLQGYVGRDRLDDLGRDLAHELVDGGDTPLWDAVSSALVEETSGESGDPADAVVVSRTAPRQTGASARFLRGLYTGLAGASPNAVGVETSTVEDSSVNTFRRAGLSSVDDVDLPVGRVALAVLLAGGQPGHYGIKNTSTRAVPPVEPVATTSGP